MLLRRDCIAIEVALFRTHLLPLERQEQEPLEYARNPFARTGGVFLSSTGQVGAQSTKLCASGSVHLVGTIMSFAHNNGSRQQQQKEDPLARRPPETCTIRSLFCSLIFFKEPSYRSKCCSRRCYPDHTRLGFPCPLLI